MQSRRPLGAYPARITERLEHWADRAPDRVFSHSATRSGALVSRDYSQALARVRRLSQALLEPRAVERIGPSLILSGNSIEHGLLALAAMFSGVLYAPIAPAYSLQARGIRHARPDFRAHAARGWCSRRRASPTSAR